MSEEKKLESYSIGEIIKALDICTTADDDMDCRDGCPMYEEDYCTTKLLKMAFDLIQRQQEELDYYKCANRELTSTNEMLKKYRKQDAKDTAKEILCELLDIEVKDEDYKMFFLDVCEKLEKFAQKYGVEVE